MITTLKRLIWKVAKWTLTSLGVLLVCLLLLIGGTYVYYEWIWQEWSPARIERITGVRIPQYKILEYNEGLRGFNGDYDDSFTFEFKTMPSEEMFDEINGDPYFGGKTIKSGNDLKNSIEEIKRIA